MSDMPLIQWGPEHGGNYEYKWKGDYLQAYLISDVGNKRPHNEDSCIMCIPEDSVTSSERGYLFAVADGMGGASAGEHASHLALKSFVESYYKGDNDNVPECLTRSLESANSLVFEESESNPEYDGMGTTFSSVLILGNHAYITQVGDSRVYLSRKHANLCQITDDHSLVAEQVRNGYITEEDAKTHSLKNLITRAVGIKDAVVIDQFVVRLESGDTMLICSDGLSNMVEDPEIEQILKLDTLHDAAKVLLGRALEKGGYDNITISLIRVIDPPPKVMPHPGAKVISIPRIGILARVKELFFSL